MNDAQFAPKVIIYWDDGQWTIFTRYTIDTAKKLHHILSESFGNASSVVGTDANLITNTANGGESRRPPPKRWIYSLLRADTLPNGLCTCPFTEYGDFARSKDDDKTMCRTPGCPAITEGLMLLKIPLAYFIHRIERVSPVHYDI